MWRFRLEYALFVNEGKCMTKTEVVEQIAASNDLSKAQASRVLNDVIEIIQGSLKKDGRFSLPGIGTFTVGKRAARKGRNPATGETIKIKATKVARFKAAPALKEAANKFKG
ncbi:HU family DNA-binding protein [Oxalobacteraceae bacterium R-40]|uniref:HU family DNA-binding protein n=1 Tax=Keguizhuia sedimenti TaxID=3064264 RepID=A0ABU1BKH7_9BURK|nr:HU family DNA-binding protein [Oxalobacteraceae bacterium R-40]